jgi:hypothetical protein
MHNGPNVYVACPKYRMILPQWPLHTNASRGIAQYFHTPRRPLKRGTFQKVLPNTPADIAQTSLHSPV